MKVGSLILVIVQVASIVIFFATGPAYCRLWPLIPFQGLGVALLVWTWLHLHPGKFGILPEPLKKSSLVTSGPFRWIRHPMYLTMILYFVPLAIEHFSFFRLGLMIVFLTDIVLKIGVEEQALKKRFSEYESYSRKTKRLIPFIY